MPANIVNTPSLVAVLHAVVKAAPSGLDAKSMASLMGKPYQTLMSELSRQDGHKLGADLLLPLLHLTEADEPLHFLARERGGVFIRLPDVDVGTSDLMLGLANSIREFGEFAAETARDVADGDIPADQLARIEREGDEAIETIMKMKKLARTAHEAKYGKR